MQNLVARDQNVANKILKKFGVFLARSPPGLWRGCSGLRGARALGLDIGRSWGVMGDLPGEFSRLIDGGE